MLNLPELVSSKDNELKDSNFSEKIYFNNHKKQGGDLIFKVSCWNGFMTYEEITNMIEEEKQKAILQKKNEEALNKALEEDKKISGELAKVKHEFERDLGIEEKNKEKELDTITKNKEKMMADQKTLLEDEKRLIDLIERANKEKVSTETELSEKLAPIESIRIKLKAQLEQLKQRNATEFMSKKLEQTVIDTTKQLRGLENQNEETTRKIKEFEENIKLSNQKLKLLIEKTSSLQEELEKTRIESEQEIENKKISIEQKKQNYIQKDENYKKEEEKLKQNLLEENYSLDIAKKEKQNLFELKQLTQKEYDDINEKTNMVLEGKKQKEDKLDELNLQLKQITNTVFQLEESSKIQGLKVNSIEQEKTNLQNLKRDINGESRKLLINSKKNVSIRDAAKIQYEKKLAEFFQDLQKKNSAIKNINDKRKALSAYKALELFLPKKFQHHLLKREKEYMDKKISKYQKDLEELKKNYSIISKEYVDVTMKLNDLKRRVPFLENENLEKEKKKIEIDKKYTELIEKKQKLLNIISTKESNIAYYTKSLEETIQKDSELKLKDLSGLSFKDAQLTMDLDQLNSKLTQCNENCSELEKNLSNLQATLDVQNSLIEDLKLQEKELENQKKKDIEAQNDSNQVVKPLKPIEINQEILEGKMIVEPITSLKDGVGNLLKLISKNTDEKKGLSLFEIIQSDNIKSCIANEILPSMLSVCKHGMDTSSWWFYTGHFWTLLQDIAYYTKEVDELSDFKILLSNAKTSVDYSGKSFSTVQLYDAYSKSFFIHCLNFFSIPENKNKRKKVTSITAMFEVILTHQENLKTYYTKQAIFRSESEIEKFKRLLVVLSKLSFDLEPVFFLK